MKKAFCLLPALLVAVLLGAGSAAALPTLTVSCYSEVDGYKEVAVSSNSSSFEDEMIMPLSGVKIHFRAYAKIVKRIGETFVKIHDFTVYMQQGGLYAGASTWGTSYVPRDEDLPAIMVSHNELGATEGILCRMEKLTS